MSSMLEGCSSFHLYLIFQNGKFMMILQRKICLKYAKIGHFFQNYLVRKVRIEEIIKIKTIILSMTIK